MGLIQQTLLNLGEVARNAGDLLFTFALFETDKGGDVDTRCVELTSVVVAQLFSAFRGFGGAGLLRRFSVYPDVVAIAAVFLRLQVVRVQ